MSNYILWMEFVNGVYYSLKAKEKVNGEVWLDFFKRVMQHLLAEGTQFAVEYIEDAGARVIFAPYEVVGAFLSAVEKEFGLSICAEETKITTHEDFIDSIM